MFHLHKQMSSEIKCFPFAYIYQSVPDHHLTGDEPGEESMTGNKKRFQNQQFCCADRQIQAALAQLLLLFGTIIIITNDDSWIVFHRSVMHKDYIVIGEGRLLPLPTQLECNHFWNTYSESNTYASTHTCTQQAWTTLLYLWLISGSGCTNIINQAD